MIKGFHLLFHGSGLAPLFHPLSASFSQKKNTFFGVFQVCPDDVSLWSEYAPGAEEKKFVISFVEVSSLIFTQTIYIVPPPPIGVGDVHFS